MPAGGEERGLREIAAAFPVRLKDAVVFALEHRVLPIDVPEASPADLSLALPGFEEEAIGTAEDLIVYKCVIVARFERAWENRPRG